MPTPVSLRIAVIDDEAVIGVSCRRALGAAGHEVEYFNDPAAGLNAALTGHFDVILLDLMMPGMSAAGDSAADQGGRRSLGSHHHHRPCHGRIGRRGHEGTGPTTTSPSPFRPPS